MVGCCGRTCRRDSMIVGVPTLKSAAGQRIAVKCESVGAGERVSDGSSEHIAYTYQLSVGDAVVGTFVTRYSHALEAHVQFVQQGHLSQLQPPLEFPPKRWFRDMTTNEGNVRLRQHELQRYFERLLGVSLRCKLEGGLSTCFYALIACGFCIVQDAGLLALPQVRDSLGLSEATSTKVMHLLTDV